MTIQRELAVTTLSILMPGALIRAQAGGTTSQSTAAELQRLQGSWEGVQAGQEAAGKISITITGNSLHFHRDTNFWFERTFRLPAGTNPQQLHATIKGCPEPDSIGKVVFAIFKIEDGTLTLAGIQASAGEPPKTFGEDNSLFKIEDGTLDFVGRKPGVLTAPQGFEDNSIFRYDLKMIQPQKLNPQPPKSK